MASELSKALTEPNRPLSGNKRLLVTPVVGSSFESDEVR